MNLPLALLLLVGSGLVIYAGITDAPGGVVGVLGSALAGKAPAGKPSAGPLDPALVHKLGTAPQHPTAPPTTLGGLLNPAGLP